MSGGSKLLSVQRKATHDQGQRVVSEQCDKQIRHGLYLGKHIPTVQQKLGSALRGASVEQGLGGMQPGSAPAYLAMGHLLFDSVEAFQQAFGPHQQAIVGDIPNYTNTQPTIQVSEVKL